MKRIHQGVKIGKTPIIGDFCSIGVPARGNSGETVIGDNALIRSNTVIYAGNIIGKKFSTGHGTVIREDNMIGNNVKIGTNSTIEGGCRIGNNATVHSNCFIGELTVIEDNAWIGPGCLTLNTKYPKHKDKVMEGPVIGRNAVIGAGSIILPGARIGENSMVGAGAIVSGDIPPGTLSKGIPARSFKRISDIRISGKKYERMKP